MALDETSQVVGAHVLDVSFVHFPISNKPRFDEFDQPGRGEPIVLVVIRSHVKPSCEQSRLLRLRRLRRVLNVSAVRHVQ